MTRDEFAEQLMHGAPLDYPTVAWLRERADALDREAGALL